jgi:hypothetical protein
MVGITLLWPSGKSTPSLATMRRIGSWVTPVTWTGAGASLSAVSLRRQPLAITLAASTTNSHLFFIA